LNAARIAGAVLLAGAVLAARQMKTGSLSAPLILFYLIAVSGAVPVARGIRSHWVAGAVMLGPLVLTGLGIQYL
jgi:hypothetical protein